MVKLNIPGTPQGKARPRFSRTGHAYTPDETRRYEARVAVLGKYAMCNRDIIPCACFVLAETPRSMPAGLRTTCQEAGYGQHHQNHLRWTQRHRVEG